MNETELPYRMHPYRRSQDGEGVALIESWLELEAEEFCGPQSP